MFKDNIHEGADSSSGFRDPYKGLRERVASWKILKWGGSEEERLPYKFLYYYYPSNKKGITDEEESIREYVYSFIEGCKGNKPMVDDAQNLVRHEVGQLLIKEFGSWLPNLTFLCMPCSSADRHRLRYKWLSETLCLDTGMENGFDHVHIIGQTAPSHQGGTDVETVEFDEGWFCGKNVILFDDILNKGIHVHRCKRALEAHGAHIVCSVFLSKVTHYHRKYQPEGSILRLSRERI